MIKFSEKALFTLVLLAFSGIMCYLSLDLSRVARLVPLRVVIPTLGLLVFQLLVDLIPQLAQKYGRFEKMDIFGVEPFRRKVRFQARAIPSEAAEEEPQGRRELSMFLWVLAMLAFIYFFGLLVAIPFYTFLYLKGHAGESWLLSLSLSAVIWGLLYGVFVFILQVSLYKGQLWGWIGA